MSKSADYEVLIPAYNAAKWIGDAIESALTQTVSPRRVIVLDDASQDSTCREVTKFGDAVALMRNSTNSGGGTARQRLLHAASAKWVQYLDADDYLLPRKAEMQLRLVAENLNTDVVYSPVIMRWEHQEREERLHISGHGDPYRLLARWELPQTGACLFRRQALRQVGGWKEGQPCCQEHELYLRLLMAGKRFDYCPFPGAVYRQWSESTVCRRNPSLTRKERIKIVNHLQDWLDKHGLLTIERLKDINQTRFDVARSEWVQNQERALMYYSAIDERYGRFRPAGASAPAFYALIHRAIGFTRAQKVAEFRRRFLA